VGSSPDGGGLGFAPGGVMLGGADAGGGLLELPPDVVEAEPVDPADPLDPLDPSADPPVAELVPDPVGEPVVPVVLGSFCWVNGSRPEPLRCEFVGALSTVIGSTGPLPDTGTPVEGS
jgi:hypothetical protein